MTRRFPYLVRRGNGLTFRISIPHDLREHFGRRELTKALPAVRPSEAVPIALEFAADSKRLFNDARAIMTSKKKKAGSEPTLTPIAPADLMRLIDEKRRTLQAQAQLDEVRGKLEQADRENAALRLQLQRAKPHLYRLKGIDDMLKSGVSMVGKGAHPAKASAPPSVEGKVRPTAPKLSVVIDGFMRKQNPSAPMFKKSRAALQLFLLVIGDKPVDQLRQGEIDGFFETLCRLPPRWSDIARTSKCDVRALAEKSWPQCISPKTFDDGYKAAIRPFLRESVRRYGDEGFPANLTTDGIKYSGARDEDECKQRAFRPDELRRLFEGAEYMSFSSSADDQDKYWLPLLGLFTGARVNELCQINPQCDIGEASGILFIQITETTEADEGVQKAVKNKGSQRDIPIHATLLRLGFMDYVRALKSTGAKRLFPGFRPKGGRASGQAEVWFRDLLRTLLLRDETQGAQIVGFHAFRHTLINRARNLDVTNTHWITGHAGSDASAVVRGYQGTLDIERKKEIVDKITFEVSIPEWKARPAAE